MVKTDVHFPDKISIFLIENVYDLFICIRVYISNFLRMGSIIFFLVITISYRLCYISQLLTQLLLTHSYLHI